MPNAYILMAALPPTQGHIDLINFAKHLGSHTTVLMVTRGSEPYQEERLEALRERFTQEPRVTVTPLHRDGLEAEGNPYWAAVLRAHGFAEGDYLVASETWGEEIAAMLDGFFHPYDLDREIRYTRATNIREDIVAHWEWLIPEFQRKLQKRIVIFGAESTGKSTLTKALAAATPNSVAVFEYARPLLEIDPALTVESMTAIWRGQKALQLAVSEMSPVPRVVFLDTDLYSTLGYWEFWEPPTIPEGLSLDAKELMADFYIQTNSNIPFEVDPIRYGGTEREQSDDYWEAVLQRYGAPYAKLEATEPEARLHEALGLLEAIIPTSIDHVRLDNE